MNAILNNLKDVTGECCVTIILTTHRTLPDNAQDSILLKNLIKEAEKKIHVDCSKEEATLIIHNLSKLAAEIDHRHNLESLVLFVNKDIAEYTRLPLAVESRVMVDKSFQTRDLIRALNKQTGYYILLLSRHRARMLEALSDKAVKEIDSFFPVENEVTTVPPAAASIANRVSSLQSEFFNKADKMVTEVYKVKPLPIVICTEESNYPEYLKVSDKKDIILGNVKGNKLMDKAHHVVEAVWPFVKNLENERNKSRLLELDSAVNSNQFLTDFNDIWSALNEGRGRTLFVKQGFFQPARLIDDRIQLVDPNQADEADVVEVVAALIVAKAQPFP